MTNEDVLRALFSAWGEGLDQGAEAIRAHFADDCLWEQMTLPTTTGPEEAAQLFLSMEQIGLRAIEVDYRNVGSSGDVVYTERIDRAIRADGTTAGEFPVVGVTEFRDGKIRAWREYFDSANLSLLS
jgi:limonene-1,2-epoxide hydrolase